MSALLDLERLLAPIRGDNPAGVDLREDTSPTSIYYKIKDARAAARAAERALEAEENPNTAPREWQTIVELAPRVLAEQSKDLEITTWLIEALVRLHGYAGLRDGFRLARGLVETFWEALYPAAEDGGIASKVAPLTGLNGEGGDGTLIQPLRKVPITDNRDIGIFSIWHYDQASALAKITDPEKLQRRITDGGVTVEKFNTSVAGSSAEFYQGLIASMEGCVDEFQKLTAALEARCGNEAPPSSNIRNTIVDGLNLVRFISKDKIPAQAPGDAAASADAGDATGAPAGGSGLPLSSTIRSREDAFKLLLTVAEYFRKSEPHSFISYTLEDIVRRGRLPLSDLLSELIPDEVARDGFLMRAGIKPAGNSGVAGNARSTET